MELDLAKLTREWETRWPETPPLGEALRVHNRNRWVRFHNLPDGKRYPETPNEVALALSRYNTIFKELDPGSEFLVLLSRWNENPVPKPTIELEGGLNADFWREADSNSEASRSIYVAVKEWASGSLDPLLKLVANDKEAGVIVAPVDLRWLCHPYDGGMDIILPDNVTRSDLRNKHQDWLSSEPSGL